MKVSRREISQTISAIENREASILNQLSSPFSKESFRKTICFTGPGGVGKSSLISRLLPLVASTGSVAWLACDPWSQKTGGSVLGDRIRLGGEDLAENIFVRSLSTRSASAISQAIRDIEVYLEPLFDQIWVETAGSGQTQLEVVEVSALNVLILQPETGDEIQWMKSGLQEEADLFIVHKSDLAGAEQMKNLLLEQGADEADVLLVSSKEKTGLNELLERLFQKQVELDWETRGKELHSLHAYQLFKEVHLQELEVKWNTNSKSWIENPYQGFG